MSSKEMKRRSIEISENDQNISSDTNFQEKRRKTDDLQQNDGKNGSQDCDISIVPDSVISLCDANEKDKKRGDSRISLIKRWKSADTWDHSSDEESTNENKVQQDSDDDVICLDDDSDQRTNFGGVNGGGFIVNGILQYDDDTTNTDLDMQSIDGEDEDTDHSTIAAPIDDDIQFVNIIQDHSLVPRVFTGYIKEFITERPKRLGMILSKECGTSMK